jgi:hypothetical protein
MTIRHIQSVVAYSNTASFVAVRPNTQQQQQQQITHHPIQLNHFAAPRRSSSSSMTRYMVDQNVLMGGGIAVAGLVAGIGLVAFTEQQGERAKERGSGLSDLMSTRIAGQLMEDVEVSSVDDLGSLTSQLERALKESGGIQNTKDLEMTEEEKKKIQESVDDGW